MHTPSTSTSSASTQRQRGTSALELALVLPLLLLMVDGVLEFGLILHNQSVLTSATSLAARAGIVQGTAKFSPEQMVQLARDYCQGQLISPRTAPAPEITVIQATDPSYQTPLSVTAQYNFNGWLVGGLLGAFQITPVLSATTVMYNE